MAGVAVILLRNDDRLNQGDNSGDRDGMEMEVVGTWV